MFKVFATSQLAAAVVLLGLTPTGTAHANVLVNGNFLLTGPNGNPVCSNMPGPKPGWSAASDWYQFAVVPNSVICTDLEWVAIFTRAIRVRTNGGDWPGAAMGNGFGQSFRPMACAKASFWINV